MDAARTAEARTCLDREVEDLHERRGGRGDGRVKLSPPWSVKKPARCTQTEIPHRMAICRLSM
jgi:hypothetical protein